jgi:hypothetical protein
MSQAQSRNSRTGRPPIQVACLMGLCAGGFTAWGFFTATPGAAVYAKGEIEAARYVEIIRHPDEGILSHTFVVTGGGSRRPNPPSRTRWRSSGRAGRARPGGRWSMTTGRASVSGLDFEVFAGPAGSQVAADAPLLSIPPHGAGLQADAKLCAEVRRLLRGGLPVEIRISNDFARGRGKAVGPPCPDYHRTGGFGCGRNRRWLLRLRDIRGRYRSPVPCTGRAGDGDCPFPSRAPLSSTCTRRSVTPSRAPDRRPDAQPEDGRSSQLSETRASRHSSIGVGPREASAVGPLPPILLPYRSHTRGRPGKGGSEMAQKVGAAQQFAETGDTRQSPRGRPQPPGNS